MAHSEPAPGGSRAHRLYRQLAATCRYALSKTNYLHASSLYAAERIATALSGLAIYVALGRRFPAEIMGVFNYSQTAANLVGPFLAAGAEAIMIRELVRKTTQNTVLGAGFVIILCNSIIAMLVPVAIVAIELPHNDLALWAVALLVFPFLFNGLLVIDHYYRAHMQVRTLVAIRMAVTTIAFMGKLALIVEGAPLLWIASAFSLEQIALSLAMFLSYQTSGKSVFRWRVSFVELRALISQLWPAMISGIVVQLFFRVNQLMIGGMLGGSPRGLSEVAQYGLAFQFIQLTNMLPAMILPAIYPRLVQLEHEDVDRYNRFLRWLLVGASMAGYIMLLGTLLLDRPILRLIFHQKFDEAATILIILSISTLFNYSGSVRAVFINVSRRTHYHLLNALVGLAILVPSSFLLIPRSGGVGAAWAAAIATFVTAIATSFLFAPTRRFGLDQLLALFLVPRRRRPAMRHTLAS